MKSSELSRWGLHMTSLVTCAIIGHPVDKSLSPVLHNAGYRELGLNWHYKRIDVTSDQLPLALANMKRDNIRGYSVTMPHKERLLELVEDHDPVVKKIGAANTVVNNQGKLKLHNTDWLGAQKMIEEVVAIKDKSALVLGAGGAGKAVVYALVQGGAKKVVVINRNTAKAQELKKIYPTVEIGRWEDMEVAIQEVDFLVNTTSVGMGEAEATPVEVDFLHRDLVVFDTIYNPVNTRLIKDAQKTGCRVGYGYKMLLWQGVEQFSLFTGVQDIPVQQMGKELYEALEC